MARDAAGEPCPVERSVNVAYLADVMRRFDLEGAWAVLVPGREPLGLSRREVERRARSAALLLNVMGYLEDEDLLSLVPRARANRPTARRSGDEAQRRPVRRSRPISDQLPVAGQAQLAASAGRRAAAALARVRPGRPGGSLTRLPQPQAPRRSRARRTGTGERRAGPRAGAPAARRPRRRRASLLARQHLGEAALIGSPRRSGVDGRHFRADAAGLGGNVPDGAARAHAIR